MCISKRRRQPAPVIQNTYVMQPAFQKTEIPPAPVKKADMEANRLKQAQVKSPRKKLTRSDRGPQSLRIRRGAAY